MVDKTLNQLIVEVEQAIYQVAGTATQVYSEALIQSKINDAFIFFATDPDKSWKRFNSYIQRTLDGVTGRTTVPVADNIQSFDDISEIYPADSQRKLVSAIPGNPLLVTGTYPLQYQYDATDIIQVLPLESVGDIVIVGRILPTLPITGDTVVPFDYLALKYYAAWSYMTEDGSNPAASELLRQQFETRYQQLSKLQDQAPIAINGRGSSYYPTQWFSN